MNYIEIAKHLSDNYLLYSILLVILVVGVVFVILTYTRRPKSTSRGSDIYFTEKATSSASDGATSIQRQNGLCAC